MNAVSTPVRDNPIKILWDDVFSELTPIKESTSNEVEQCKAAQNNNIKSYMVVKKPKNEKGCKAHSCQKRKIEIEFVKSPKKKLASDNKIKINAVGNNSNDIFTDEAPRNKINDNSFQKLSEKNSLDIPFIDDDELFKSQLTQLLANNVNNNVERAIESVKSDDEVLLDKIEAPPIKSLENHLPLTPNPIDSLRDSDVMKWSDESLLPRESKVDLSDQIKQKLLGNANKKEIVKSQTSGWTQLNFSKLMNGSFGYHELGPFYGLPAKVKQLYEELKGITELYSWQKECLNLDAVKLHQNLVYALPTSGGKTLVAEILILRELLCYNRNVLFILPFVSIVQEKIRDFSQLALELGFLVEEYAAGKGVIPPKKRRRRNSIFVATIEKALVIINSLIESKRLEEIGLIVVDELHLLSEEGRGATLESLLTQVLYTEKKIQIIGMTATIGNLSEIARFLNAESFTGNFRPVQLSEYIKCENKIYAIDWSSESPAKEVRTLNSSKPGMDPDGIGELVAETIPHESILIFCPTKKNCENVASLLCKILPRTLASNKEEEKKSLIRALLSETNDQICPVLKETIPYGIAYHHSGLTAGERKLLEESFRDGTLCVICCTSTLAAGVNLPAKRVILRAPFVGREFINLAKYKQMVGRAGRTGFGSEGESYLICQPGDFEKVGKLLQSKMDEITSKMDSEACKDLVLSAIGLGIAVTRRSLREFLSYTLLHLQADNLGKDTNKITDTCISTLYKQGALKIIKPETLEENSISQLELNGSQIKKRLKIANDCNLSVSRLGRAAMKGGLTLERAHELYGDLVKAQSSLVLLTSLHLLYLVTPYESVTQIKPNFSAFFNVYMQLDSKEVHTAKVIGISEFVVSKLATGIKPKNVKDAFLSRFYISLILNELWKQQTVWDVATLFQLPRGLIQTLMSSAATFASSVLRFCEELEELWPFKSLLVDFIPRLSHCCSAELLPLMDLPAVKRGRAKQLYDAGFRTLHILATAKPTELVGSIDYLSTKVASQIIAAAKLLLVEKAENLKEEADEVLEGLAEKSAPKEA